MHSSFWDDSDKNKHSAQLGTSASAKKTSHAQFSIMEQKLSMGIWDQHQLNRAVGMFLALGKMHNLWRIAKGGITPHKAIHEASLPSSLTLRWKYDNCNIKVGTRVAFAVAAEVSKGRYNLLFGGNVKGLSWKPALVYCLQTPVLSKAT